MTTAVIDCSFEKHAEAILGILNEAIANSTALYDYKPRSLQDVAAWFEARHKNNFPVIGVENDTGKLLAFASYGTFRAWPAYKYTVEHSVYVHEASRGQGLGYLLMRALIAAAEQNDMHAMIGAIDISNSHSISLHERLGFKRVGILPQVGFKFGHWLDLAFYQLLLKTPEHPVET